MNLNLKGKFALITGASRGIGAQICIDLMEEGVQIFGVARKFDQVGDEFNTLMAKTGSRIIELDLTEANAIESLKATLKEFGVTPNIVVNNLGGNLNLTDPLASFETCQKNYEFNFGIAHEINRYLIPSMQAEGWGRICHISSISALENQGTVQYCMAKAALNAYVRSLGRYLSPSGITVTSVMPGAIFADGGYWDDVTRDRPEHLSNFINQRMAIGRLGTTSEISQVVAFLVSDRASFMVGSNVLVDGGQGRAFYTD